MNTMDLSTYLARNRVISAIRNFFLIRNYLEIDPPILSPMVIPEATIPLFQTEISPPDWHSPGNQPPNRLYLLPSPEYYLKQLIAQGWGNLFSISRCFRNQEVLTPQHSFEFTMLEYYSLDADYRDSIAITQELFRQLPLDLNSSLGDSNATQLPSAAESTTPGSAWPGPTGLHLPFRILTMEEAFTNILGCELSPAADPDNPSKALGELKKMAHHLGQSVEEDQDWDDLFQRIFLTHIEPQLPQDRPLVLIDYPYLVPSTAKRRGTTPWAERWELYAGGIEIANVYTEENDPEVTRRFIENELAAMAKTGSAVQPDPSFVHTAAALPPCSGGALGVDRLVMVALGLSDIRAATLFPLHGRV